MISESWSGRFEGVGWCKWQSSGGGMIRVFWSNKAKKGRKEKISRYKSECESSVWM